VAEDELLKRIDVHMARGNDHMARGNEHMARGNELMEDIREEMRLSRAEREQSKAMFADLRVFMREITLRVERTGREQVEAIRDLRAQTQAQTEALLRVIDRMDRLDPGGSAAGA
jgi:hypothetical protein